LRGWGRCRLFGNDRLGQANEQGKDESEAAGGAKHGWHGLAIVGLNMKDQ
jgi:hypothetical protein